MENTTCSNCQKTGEVCMHCWKCKDCCTCESFVGKKLVKKDSKK
ncbi:MAG: hypothetical protein Q8L27_00640 [archaeon]|nr:hypothetical protein [archaeon]